MIWTANSSSTGEWYAHRIIIGIAVAPIESLPEISVSDLMFAHERGTWMSAYVLTLFESNFIAPLIAGWLNDAIGWRWTMNFGAIVAAVSFAILFFFMEETMYFRHMTEGTQSLSRDLEMKDIKTDPDDTKKSQPLTPSDHVDDGLAMEKATAPRSFANKMMPFRRLPGRPTVRQMFFMMIRPLIIIVKFPCVAWAGFIYGINLSWYQVLNGTASPVLSAPPYEWSSAYIGCIYAGPMVGAVFGCLWAGTIADKLAIYLARRNGGWREPEQRLWPLAIAGIFSAAGLITWVSNLCSGRTEPNRGYTDTI
jgi:MFS family permease